MSRRDPLDSFEEALFRAARRERPHGALLERTANAVVASHRRQRSLRAALAVAGALAVAAGAALVLRPSPSTELIQAETIAPRRAVSSGAAVSLVPVQAEPETETESAPAPRAAASDSADPLRGALAPSVSSTTLEEEQVMLERARSELGAGNALSALSLLDQYDKVSGGHLTREATLLRIEALSSSGRASLAEKLARRFVDSDPESPLAERARAYISKPPQR